METRIAPTLDKVGPTRGRLTWLPAFTHNLASQEPNARGSHSLLAWSCGRDGHGRIFEAPGRRGIQKRSSGESWAGFYVSDEKPLSCTCCTQIPARSRSRKRSVKY